VTELPPTNQVIEEEEDHIPLTSLVTMRLIKPEAKHETRVSEGNSLKLPGR
jgi:hypothetical protein